MVISLRFKVFAAFVLMAGAMTALLVLSTTAMDRQAGTSVATLARLDALLGPMARLQALPHQAQALVRAHLQAFDPTQKARIEAELVAVETAEALALSALSALAQGAEAALVEDLGHLTRQASDMRRRLVAISARNANGKAVALATQELPVLRAQITDALRNVVAQSGDPLAAARAEAAMNAMAAAQKNALLYPEAGYVAGQLAAAARAEADMAAALGLLAAKPLPGVALLQELVHELQALDVQMDQLVRDSGGDRALALFDAQLRPLDLQRQDALSGLGQLMQTSRSAIQQATLTRAAEWRWILVILADVALVLGFGLVVLALMRLGRGLEGAVRLAEQIADLPSKGNKGNLTGRLTSALVQISAGQTGVLTSLEALAAGRPPRQDLPEKLRQRFGALAQSLSTRTGVERGRSEAAELLRAIDGALQDAQLLSEGAGQLTRALGQSGGCEGLVCEAERHALVAERQLATLIVAQRQSHSLSPDQTIRVPAMRSMAHVPQPMTQGLSDRDPLDLPATDATTHSARRIA